MKMVYASRSVLTVCLNVIRLSGRSAVNPLRLSVAASVDKPSAGRMAKWRLAPVGIRFESCRLPGYSRSAQSLLEHSRPLHSHCCSRRTGSTLEHSIHSAGKQHKHSPKKEQGVSWESFPQNSGWDRIGDSQPVERIPSAAAFAAREAQEASR
jgi:hypothetical protein